MQISGLDETWLNWTSKNISISSNETKNLSIEIYLPDILEAKEYSFTVSVLEINNSFIIESVNSCINVYGVDTCDLNNDGITIHDYNDLMTAYKCFLGIIKNCNNHYHNWNLIKQEYQCFTNNKQY